jgi:predicted phosphodiesterase
VRKYPDAPARSLARRLVRESGNALTLEQARSRIRSVLGQNGRQDRSRARAPREARVPGQGVPVPPTSAKPWLPFDLTVVGRVGILSDCHVPYHSPIAVGAAVAYLVEQEISALVLNGDIADFYSISRWTKDPAERNLKAELDAIRAFLRMIRQQFPTQLIVYKSGNHEERWRHWLFQHAPEISDDSRMGLTAWLGLDDLGIYLIEDQRPIMVGKLPVLHGHERGKQNVAPVNQARGAFLRLNHTALEGHGHRTSGHCEPDMFGRETFNWSTGCLCDLNPEYARINKWNWGFALVTVHEDGEEFDVQNLRITADGTVRTS